MLYHGTSSKNIGRILNDGISPRGDLGVESTWDEHPSKEDKAYLTTAYAFFFAINAASDEEKAVVFEIDETRLDTSNLYPDEDFICDALDLSVSDARDSLEHHQGLWEESMCRLGNCCHHGTIPATAITRYCLFDHSERPELEDTCLDSHVTHEAFKFVGQKYIGLTKWFFGDVDAIPSFIPAGEINIEFDEDVSDEDKERFTSLFKNMQKQQSLTNSDRSGIEIINC